MLELTYRFASFTNSLASFTREMNINKLNKDHIEQIKKLLIDYLCASISGSQTEVSKTVFNYFKDIDGTKISSAYGHNTKLSHLHAAFVNGTSAHSLDFDDGYTAGSVHVGSVIFPAVLAVAEKLESKAEDIICSVVVGYEVSIRIASVIHPSSREIGYHNTSVAGVFGVAAAVSYLLNSSYEQIISAFGIASSFAGGTFAFLGSGSEVKRIHPGIAARDGIIAAELAHNNLAGPSNIFERISGVFDVFAGTSINTEIMNRPLGNEFEFMNVYFKPFPCCRHLHVVIEAVRKIKQDYSFSLDSINKIDVGVNKVASFHNNKKFDSLLDAQMSIPYVVGAVLIDTEISLSSFNLQRPDLEKLTNLSNKVNVFLDESCESVYPEKRKTNIAINLNNNEVRTFSLDKVKGEYPNPMSLEEVENKFYANCSDIIGKEKAKKVISSVKNLDLLNLLN